MPATKTSAETAATALTGAELIRGVQGGANVKATVDQFRDYGIKSGVPFTAMGALEVNVAIPGNSYSATGDVTFTYSNATPAEGTSTFLRISADGTARTITIPSTWSIARNGAITSLLVPASSVMQVKLQYVGARWEIIGDPVATNGTGNFVLDQSPTITGPFIIPNVISPTQLAADTDDWNPTDLATAHVIRLDTDANLRYLSSIVAQASRVLRIENISANTLILKDQIAALGTAANRFILGGQDLPLFPGDAIELRYDGTSARWRAVDALSRVIPPSGKGFYGSRPVFSALGADIGVFNSSATVSGVSAGHTAPGGDANNPGEYVLATTGTDTNGRAAYLSGPVFILLGNLWYYRAGFRVTIPTLSDGTETFVYRVGFLDAVNGDPVDGVFLRYTHGTNSGNFELVLRSNSGETAVNCNAGPTAGGWDNLDIVVTPTRVEAYKNGVLIGSTTTMTNLPVGAGRQTGIGQVIIKSAGTTARTAGLAFIQLVGYKATP